MIAVTGATGQLGRLVIESLLRALPPDHIVAAVRTPEKASDLAGRGVVVRRADYNQPQTLETAFAGVSKLLLISSSELGQRVKQHQAVIEAAGKAGVGLMAYTSILHADATPLALGEEHRQTEALLTASGIPWVILRNGWYTENYLAAIPDVVARGVLAGCAGQGRVASAVRADYAEAAAAVLAGQGQAGRVYELAGDEAYALADLAAEISRQTGRTVVYHNLDQQAYQAALVAAGLPPGLAGLLADADAGAAKGGLFDDSRSLSRLIGRPTTPLSAAVRAAVQHLPA